MAAVKAILLLQFALGVLAQLGTYNTTIPSFVKTYAPLVYLDQSELYLPSDIQAQINNSNPTVNYSTLNSSVPSPLLLSNLAVLNDVANCTSFSNCDLYLTSKVDITTNPSWLYGVLPDPVTGETKGIKSTAVIVNRHNDGVTTDVFYMFFYAFNYGLQVLDYVLGDHVGDWEHVMIRFVNSAPSTMFFSAHDGGAVYTWSALEKNGSRPIVYSAIGSHANFANEGTHTRQFGTLPLNDYTSKGPLWDPVAGSSALYYSYIPAYSPSSTPVPFNISAPQLPQGNGTFLPATTEPVSWLYYLGAWGDKQYADSDPRQFNLGGLNISFKYESGPTGPLDKNLNRSGTCPNEQCTTLSAIPSVSGTRTASTVVRVSSTAMPTTGSSTRPTASTTGTGGAGAGATSTGLAVRKAVETGVAVLGAGLFAVLL